MKKHTRKTLTHLNGLTHIEDNFYLVGVNRGKHSDVNDSTLILRENCINGTYILHYITIVSPQANFLPSITLVSKAHNKRGVVAINCRNYTFSLNNQRAIDGLLSNVPHLATLVQLITRLAERIHHDSSVVPCFHYDEETGEYYILLTNTFAASFKQCLPIRINKNAKGEILLTYNNVTRSFRRTMLALKYDLRKFGTSLHAVKGEQMYTSYPKNNGFITDIQQAVRDVLTHTYPTVADKVKVISPCTE